MNFELKPCPFCGCSVRIERKEYPNGEAYNAVHGWHHDGCILQWQTIEPVDDFTDEPLPPEEVAERWNRRWEDA